MAPIPDPQSLNALLLELAGDISTCQFDVATVAIRVLVAGGISSADIYRAIARGVDQFMEATKDNPEMTKAMLDSFPPNFCERMFDIIGE